MASAVQTNSLDKQLTTSRIDSLDLLRGIVMVLMVVDHVRDYFTNIRFDPMDPDRTYAALFFTRWITHFCAPVFVFLTGTGACLYGARRSHKELVSFLVTRGLWLIFLELTILRFAWTFNLRYDYLFAIVIWAIGCGLLALAGLVFLPPRTVGWIGVAIICLHNLTDGIKPADFGPLAPLWQIAHVPSLIQIAPGHMLMAAYPILPWIGVIAAGYGFGQLFSRDTQERRRIFIRLGVALTFGFVVLRGLNIYGDPLKWSMRPDALHTLYAFLNCQKYPPSLLYLLMTLGPAILLLGFLQGVEIRAARPLVIFGRVPLFYYTIHIYLVHGLAALLAVLHYGSAPWMFAGIPNTLPGTELPPEYGYGLGTVYLIWAAIVLALYPLCKWFAAVKQRRRDPWLSYL